MGSTTYAGRTTFKLYMAVVTRVMQDIVALVMAISTVAQPIPTPSHHRGHAPVVQRIVSRMLGRRLVLACTRDIIGLDRRVPVVQQTATRVLGQ